MAISDDLKKIAEQEEKLVLPKFDYEVAWRIGTRLREMAVKRNLPVVIDVRRFGEPLFYAALPGTTPNNAEWVRRKSNVIARYHRSSYGLGRDLDSKNTTLQEKHDLPLSEFAAHGGGFPIRVVNAGIVGSVTVSGLPQRADHELVVEALCLETGQDYASLRLGPED